MQEKIVKDKESEMRRLTTGCNEICPLCRRKCDGIHSLVKDKKVKDD